MGPKRNMFHTYETFLEIFILAASKKSDRSDVAFPTNTRNTNFYACNDFHSIVKNFENVSKYSQHGKLKYITHVNNAYNRKIAT
jgi:hypothetical protein